MTITEKIKELDIDLLGVLLAFAWFCTVMWWDLGCFLVSVWRIFVI